MFFFSNLHDISKQEAQLTQRNNASAMHFVVPEFQSHHFLV